jgi:intracellular sulfur oxidation DsrE/DsrF family protein
MNRLAALFVPGIVAITLTPSLPASWPPARAPVIPQADGYIAIPNAAVPLMRGRTYRAIFDATLAADRPGQLLPALNMAGSELNALGVTGVPLGYAKFVVVFHDAALNGILADARYRTKYGIPNPNLPVLSALKKAGVELYACGQNLASAHIDPSTISRDVTVASDALIVLMTYQNDGFALLSY